MNKTESCPHPRQVGMPIHPMKPRKAKKTMQTMKITLTFIWGRSHFETVVARKLLHQRKEKGERGLHTLPETGSRIEIEGQRKLEKKRHSQRF